MSLNNQILIVAEGRDQEQARKLLDELGKQNVIATLWSASHYFHNEAQLANMQITISVGGPNTNVVTKTFMQITEHIDLNCGDDIEIRTGFRKAVVYGTYHCIDAVECFIKKGLKKFLKDCNIAD